MPPSLPASQPPSLDASLHLILRKAKGLSRRMGRLLSLWPRFL